MSLGYLFLYKVRQFNSLVSKVDGCMNSYENIAFLRIKCQLIKYFTES